MDSDLPLTSHLKHIGRFRLGVGLLLITTFLTPAANYLHLLLPPSWFEQPASGEIPFIIYGFGAILFLLVIIYIWSIFCLSHRPESEVDSPAYARVRLWARILAIVALPLYILAQYGFLLMLWLVEIDWRDDGTPAWFTWSHIFKTAFWLAKPASVVLGLLCLGYLQRIAAGKTGLFMLNKVLIWMVALSGLFTMVNRVFTVITWSPLKEQSREHLLLSRTLRECSTWINLAVLVFEIILLILFLRFINGEYKNARQTQKNISLLD